MPSNDINMEKYFIVRHWINQDSNVIIVANDFIHNTVLNVGAHSPGIARQYPNEENNPIVGFWQPKGTKELYSSI